MAKTVMKKARYVLILVTLLSLSLLFTACFDGKGRETDEKRESAEEENFTYLDPDKNLPFTTEKVKSPSKTDPAHSKDYFPLR